MDDRTSNFRGEERRSDTEKRGARYTPEQYMGGNRDLARSRDRRYEGADDADMYDEYNSGKEENFKGGGYFGSNYGSISELNRGRNYESNAGYRDNYEHLPTGQWPEIERAAQSRGFDLRQYELSQRGVHRGKGPRAYQRSDQRITEDINDLLTEDPYIDASDIEVSVEKGEVTLSGTIESKHLKRRVEEVVERVAGVKHVENKLRAKLSGGQTVNIRNAGEK
jgi:hypothetical protein